MALEMGYPGQAYWVFSFVGPTQYELLYFFFLFYFNFFCANDSKYAISRGITALIQVIVHVHPLFSIPSIPRLFSVPNIRFPRAIPQISYS